MANTPLDHLLSLSGPVAGGANPVGGQANAGLASSIRLCPRILQPFAGIGAVAGQCLDLSSGCLTPYANWLLG